MATRMETIKQKRAERKQWVSKRLKMAGNTVLDAASYIGINPRTWREWVALGVFPKQKESLILEVLGNPDTELSRHFSWRGA